MCLYIRGVTIYLPCNREYCYICKKDIIYHLFVRPFKCDNCKLLKEWRKYFFPEIIDKLKSVNESKTQNRTLFWKQINLLCHIKNLELDKTPTEFGKIYSGKYTIKKNKHIVTVKSFTENDSGKFLKDIDLLKKLGNDRTVQIYCSKDWPRWDMGVIIMETFEETLGDFVDKYADDHYHDFVRDDIMRKLMSTVRYMHSENMKHGNLQPKNIGVTWTSGRVPSVKIQFHFELEASYTSKERFEGNFEQPADVFSLGCIYYFLCKKISSSLLFDNEDEVKSNQADEKRQRKLDEMAEEWPLECDLIKRMTFQNPTDRNTLEELSSHPSLWTHERLQENLNQFIRRIEGKEKCVAASEIKSKWMSVGLDWFYNLPNDAQIKVLQCINQNEQRNFKTTTDILSVIRILSDLGDKGHFDLVKQHFSKMVIELWECMYKHGSFVNGVEFSSFKSSSLKLNQETSQSLNIEIGSLKLDVTLERKSGDETIHSVLYIAEGMDTFNSIHEARWDGELVVVQFLEPGQNQRLTRKLEQLSSVIEVLKFIPDASIPNLFRSNKMVIVTEMFNGTLENFVKQKKTKSYFADCRKSAMRQILEAYKEIHNKGIAHRSVIPRNIAVTKIEETHNSIEFKIKLCGFDENWPDSDIQQDFRDDIFKLGSVFYFLFDPESDTGSFPTFKLPVDNNFHQVRRSKLNALKNKGFKLVADRIQEMTIQNRSKQPTINQLVEHNFFKD